MTDTDYGVEPTAEELAAASEPARFGEQGRGLAPELAADKLRSNLDTPVAVTDETQYATLKPGQKYIDPEGNQRIKPYEVKSRIDYENVPEGADYLDPEGASRKKPVYKGIGYSAQTLHSMAVTDKERKRVLEKFYPGKVQGEGADLYVVDEDGTYRKPGRMNDVSSGTGVIAGNIAPMGLGAIGSVFGAGVGTALAPGPGTVGGGAVGGASGGLAGQYFNDIILKLNGVYDRTNAEEMLDKGLGVVASVGGDLAGRGIAAFVPSVKAGVSKAGSVAPDIANKILGTDAGGLARARRIAELGENEAGVGPLSGSSTAPGISTYSSGAPYLEMLQETMHEKFTTSGTRRKAAETAYGKEVEPLVESMAAGKQIGGVDDFVGPPTKESVKATTEGVVDDLISPPAAVSTRGAGEALQRRALQESGEIDARFAEELAKRQREAQVGLTGQSTQRETIQTIAQERHRNASQLINAALQDVEQNANRAVQAAAQGSNSGDLWQRVGDQLRQVKQALTTRFGQNAREAYSTVPPGARIQTAPLVAQAEDFLAQMPVEFEARNPVLVRRIRALGRRPDPDVEGEFLPPPALPLSEIHQLRTDLRAAADYYDLPSDFKNGSLKTFAGNVDQLMDGVRETPQFRTAMNLLDENDAWYRQERPVFNAVEMKAVIRGLENGEPADPELLFKVMVKPGHTDLIARTAEVVGPNLWNGVRAAQRNRWLQNARSGQFDRAVDAGKFAREIISADNDGTLMAVQGREQGQQLLTLAQQIGALNGELPVTYRPNDTAFDIFRQARDAAVRAQREAAVDPLKVLGTEMARIERRVAAERRLERMKDPLRFLNDKSYGADQAVNKILGSEDLILATANRFGEHSPEFNALRQVWMEQVFKGTLEPGKALGKASPEVQRIMMGVNLDTARKIAEDMNFIMGTKALRGGGADGGQSIQAAEKLTHPLGGKTLSRAGRLLPGANAAGRAGWQAYYSFINKVLESPSTMRFLEKSYSGGAESRKATRDILSSYLQRAGAMGTAGAQGLYQTSDERLSLPQ